MTDAGLTFVCPYVFMGKEGNLYTESGEGRKQLTGSEEFKLHPPVQIRDGGDWMSIEEWVELAQANK